MSNPRLAAGETVPVAMVTGAIGGIGGTVVTALAAAGYQVIAPAPPSSCGRSGRRSPAATIPRRCIQPQTLAAMVTWVLAAPRDGYVAEMTVLAGQTAD